MSILTLNSEIAAFCNVRDIALTDSEIVVIEVFDGGCCLGYTGNANCSEDELPDISDISRLIDFLYLTHAPLCCLEEADVNVSGGDPDITDITALIDFLYLSHSPLPSCP